MISVDEKSIVRSKSESLKLVIYDANTFNLKIYPLYLSSFRTAAAIYIYTAKKEMYSLIYSKQDLYC